MSTGTACAVGEFYKVFLVPPGFKCNDISRKMIQLWAGHDEGEPNFP